MNIILFQPEEIQGDNAFLPAADPRAIHINSVLKKQPGDSIKVGLINGRLGVATLHELTHDLTLVLNCEWTEAPPRPQLELILACPRPKVLTRLWPQMAALGVRRIRITNAAKVERFYFDSHAVQESTYRPLLIQGLQQAGCTHLPKVEIHRFFKPLVEDQLEPGRVRLALHPAAAGNMAAATPPDLLIIGPEGGWTDFECGLLQDNGFNFANLGSRILRTDTAVISALAMSNGRHKPASNVSRPLAKKIQS